MKAKIFFLGFLVVVLVPFYAFPSSEHTHRSKYVGQEKREIKSLSATDIDELKTGKGWGLAKAAELNGVPGPAHLLELKEEISLTSDQVLKIERIYKEMKKKAISLGIELIELERQLNNHFAKRTITDKLLLEMLEKIAHVRKQLRYAHLVTHLKTPNILTHEQIELYNKLRGYTSNYP